VRAPTASRSANAKYSTESLSKERVRIGISACLLGDEVRYDGGHKRDDFLADRLARFVTFVRVCPEVEIGLGTPRDPIRLVRAGGALRLVNPKTGDDHTDAMTRYAARRVREIAALDLSGYVLKKNSPSCGMERVKTYDTKGVPAKSGSGLFARALLDALPDLPVEEEGRLLDSDLRENFLTRVFVYRRLRDVFAGADAGADPPRRWTIGDLVRFHTAIKLLLFAHEPRAYESLGRLVAGAKSRARSPIAAEYARTLMAALARVPTRRRHVNVLQHMAGYFTDRIDADARAELAGVIVEFRRGEIPLEAVLTLVRHHVRTHGIDYLTGQIYLEPYPKGLARGIGRESRIPRT